MGGEELGPAARLKSSGSFFAAFQHEEILTTETFPALVESCVRIVNLFTMLRALFFSYSIFLEEIWKWYILVVDETTQRHVTCDNNTPR